MNDENYALSIMKLEIAELENLERSDCAPQPTRHENGLLVEIILHGGCFCMHNLAVLLGSTVEVIFKMTFGKTQPYNCSNNVVVTQSNQLQSVIVQTVSLSQTAGSCLLSLVAPLFNLVSRTLTLTCRKKTELELDLKNK